MEPHIIFGGIIYFFSFHFMLRKKSKYYFLRSSVVFGLIIIVPRNCKPNAEKEKKILNGYQTKAYSVRQSQMTIDQLIVAAPIVAFIART